MKTVIAILLAAIGLQAQSTDWIELYGSFRSGEAAHRKWAKAAAVLEDEELHIRLRKTGETAWRVPLRGEKLAIRSRRSTAAYAAGLAAGFGASVAIGAIFPGQNPGDPRLTGWDFGIAGISTLVVALLVPVPEKYSFYTDGALQGEFVTARRKQRKAFKRTLRTRYDIWVP